MKRLLMALSVLFVAEVASAQCLGNITVEEGNTQVPGQVIVRFDKITPNGISCGAVPSTGTSWIAYYCKSSENTCQQYPIKVDKQNRNRAWIQANVAGFFTIFAYNRFDFVHGAVRIKRVK